MESDYTQEIEDQEEAPESAYPNVVLSDADQKKIVNTCLQFKTAAVNAWRGRKEKMKTSYAYYQNQFVGNDLLPTLEAYGAQGQQNSANSGRTRVFLPIAKQIAVQLYAGMKLSLFPDDENYFQIRSKTGQYQPIENDLTRAVEIKLKEAEFTEKYGQVLQNLIIFGCSVSQPTMQIDSAQEWVYNEMTGQYDLFEYEGTPLPTIQAMNPIQFYPDPSIQWCDKSKWAYLDNKKKQEILDSPYYFNKRDVQSLDLKETRTSDKQGNYPDLGVYSGLTTEFTDVEDVVRYDLYYMPLLKCNGKEYRNFLCGIVEDRILVRFQPNPYPFGKNPVVFVDWRPDPHSPIGDGPLDDIQELQKMINIYENYKIDVMSKTGNRFIARKDVDMSDFFGAAGGVGYAENPSSDVVSISGNMMEPQLIQNMMGILKAEAQILTGSNQPFQGSSEIDFKKTATELKIIQENSVTIAREILEHVGIKGLKPLLERFCYMLAQTSGGPEQFRLDDENANLQKLEVDFRYFLTGDFSVEVTTINPSQSKQAQIELLMQLIAMINQGGPMAEFARDGGYHALKQISELGGLKGVNEIYYTPKEIEQRRQQQLAVEQQMMMNQMAQSQGMV